MDQVRSEIGIQRPAGEVFAYLADIANHPEFLDHWYTDWRLTREDSFGRGAGARFKVKQWNNRFPWVDQTFLEVEPPHRIVEVGRGGKYNRTRVVSEWVVEPDGAGASRVAFTTESEGKLLSDRVFEVLLLTRGRTRRNARKGLRRLRGVLESDRDRGARATIAGGPRKPATGTPLR